MRCQVAIREHYVTKNLFKNKENNKTVTKTVAVGIWSTLKTTPEMTFSNLLVTCSLLSHLISISRDRPPSSSGVSAQLSLGIVH